MFEELTPELVESVQSRVIGVRSDAPFTLFPTLLEYKTKDEVNNDEKDEIPAYRPRKYKRQVYDRTLYQRKMDQKEYDEKMDRVETPDVKKSFSQVDLIYDCVQKMVDGEMDYEEARKAVVQHSKNKGLKITAVGTSVTRLRICMRKNGLDHLIHRCQVPSMSGKTSEKTSGTKRKRIRKRNRKSKQNGKTRKQENEQTEQSEHTLHVINFTLDLMKDTDTQEDVGSEDCDIINYEVPSTDLLYGLKKRRYGDQMLLIDQDSGDDVSTEEIEECTVPQNDTGSAEEDTNMLEYTPLDYVMMLSS